MARRAGVEVALRSGNRHDACTHAYVSARLTVRLGERIARWIGDLNERLGSDAEGKPLEAAMDRHNNGVGRAIGRDQREHGDRAATETARRVARALDAGELRILADGGLVASDGATPRDSGGDTSV